MSASRILLSILVADLRQRLRAPRTWVLMALVAAGVWWSFPPATADYLTVSFGDGARAHYSSAWIGMVVASLYGALMSLVGFYMVRGTVVRDFDTGVWQLLVTTPMHRAGYLLAKWLSHVALFGLMLVIGLAVGAIAQAVRAEVRTFDVFEMIKPALVIAMPALAVTATLAVWFDLVPWLRRGAGNVLYFFVWTFLLAGGIVMRGGRFPGDPQGMSVLERALGTAQGVKAGTSGLGVGTTPLNGKAPLLFDWTHWSIGADALAGRAAWLLIAVAVLLAASGLLDRFAAHRGGARAASTDGLRLRWLDALLAPLRRHAFGALVIAEVRLALRSRRRWWFVLMAGVFAAQAFAPSSGLIVAILAGWLLSMDVFGRAVLRERDTRTGALVFSAAGMRQRLLVARVVVAVGMAWAVTLPALLRLGATQPIAALALAVIGASIAFWGLALGALFRNARPFELALIVTAYASVQGALVLNAIADPMSTLIGHAIALPIAGAVLIGAWRPLAARTH